MRLRKRTALERLSANMTKREDFRLSAIADDDISKTLIIGDCMIRDVSERGLMHVVVKCMPSARIEDVSHELRTDKILRDYKNVILHIGTNNCSSSKGLDRADSDYRKLLRAFGEIFPGVKVAMSTICPRNDAREKQVRVDQLNRMIREIAKQHRCVVIDNDNNFKMKDDSADRSLLDKSGLYLTQAGTLRLLRNFQGAVPTIMRSNDSKRSDEKKTRPTSVLQKTIDNHRIRHRSTSRSHSRHISRHRFCDTDQLRYKTNGSCKNCGERNHPARQCKFEEPLICHNCFGLGHKSWMCTIKKKTRSQRDWNSNDRKIKRRPEHLQDCAFYYRH